MQSKLGCNLGEKPMSAQALDDATLIAEYAAARGLLPPDSTLPAAINTARTALAAGEMTPDQEQKLAVAVNAAAKLIQPMTIDKLRTQAAPAMVRLRRAIPVKGDVFAPAAIYAICVALMFLIMGWTVQFNRLTGFAAELKETEGKNILSLLDEVDALSRKIGATGPVSNPAPPAGEPGGQTQQPVRPDPRADEQAYAANQKILSDFQVKMQAIRDLDSKIRINTQSVAYMVELEIGRARLWRMLAFTFGWNIDLQGERRPLTFDTSKCAKSMNAAEGAAGSPPATQGVCGYFKIAEKFGLWNQTPEQLFAATMARRGAESATTLLGSAILPLMYGLLGAGVFLLRGYLKDSHPSLGDQWPRGATAFLRLGLGGIAGLAIGWFWIPKAGENPFQNTPFALAFLAGFSIELLFSLLDRILIALNPAAAPQQAPQRQDETPKADVPPPQERLPERPKDEAAPSGEQKDKPDETAAQPQSPKERPGDPSGTPSDSKPVAGPVPSTTAKEPAKAA